MYISYNNKRKIIKKIEKAFPYLLSIIACFFVVKEMSNTINLFELGGILATFSSAILSTLVVLMQKCEKRVDDNICILYEKIYKQKIWKRWSFLKRKYSLKLLNDKEFVYEITNPKLRYFVGTHEIFIKLPTVDKDFFELSVFKDFKKMKKYYKAFLTTTVNNDNLKKDCSLKKIFEYECTLDILEKACLYKLFSFFKDFSIGMFIISIVMAITGMFM